MSLPTPRTRAGSMTIYSTNASGGNDPGYPQTSTFTCTEVASTNRPVPKPSPFRYRIKSWVYKGQVYTRVKGYIPKKIRYAPNTWRDPKPYKGDFTEGDVTHFYGCNAIRNGLYPLATTAYVGDLGCSNYGVVCPAIPAESAGLENQAVIKALNRLKDNTVGGSAVNLAVAFAERGETAELLVGTLSGLAKAARSLRRGDMRGVATGLGLTHPPKRLGGNLSFSEKWLELQYGWQPLYNDVFDCVSALHQRDQDDAKRYTVTATAKVTGYHLVENFRNKPFNSNPGTAQTMESTEKGFIRLDYYLENPLIATLAALGITNPATVVWERVPFSFAVDWFLPVGNYLSALDATLGYKFRAGSFTRLFRRNYSGWLTPGIVSGNIVPMAQYGRANVRQLAIDRRVYASSPLPRVPSFKNPFPKNGIHIANAIALFASSMRLT